MTTSYCYLPDDYEGHRPANREQLERVGRGAVYSWPSTTTIHMDLMRRTRATLDDAHNDGVLDAAAHEHELANPEITEPIHHRSGCPHSRTGKCLCTYLAQWDRDLVSNGMPPVALEASKERQIAEANFEQLLTEEMAKPLTAFTAQMADEGRVITIDTLHGRTSEWDGVFKDPEPQLQLPVVIITGQADAAEVAEKIVKDNPRWFGELPAGTYQKQEPAADAALLHNTELSLTFWKGQAKHWQKGYWIMAGGAVLGWGLAVARGVWGF